MPKLAIAAKPAPVAQSIAADLPNRPGVFMEIPAVDLKIDADYQRHASKERIAQMAANWNWVACAAITVALRAHAQSDSGDYYVVDGQHRVLAAQRAKLKEPLPCIVFESIGVPAEAQGFLDINVGRRPVSVVARYRVMLMTGDPVALKVKDLLDSAGLIAGDNTEGGPTPKTVRCIAFLLEAMRLDPTTLQVVWPIVVKINEDANIHNDCVKSLFYLERQLRRTGGETSLAEKRWSNRLLQVGRETLMRNIHESAAFYGAATKQALAAGALRAINHGLRNKLCVSAAADNIEEE